MEQAEFFRLGIESLERLQIPYMLVGSAASSIYGEPRFTQDLDIVIDPTPEQLEALCAALPPDEFYLSREAAREALERAGQFNLIHPESGNKIDFVIARRDEMGRAQFDRRRRIALFPGFDAVAAAPEDVILSKLLFYQEGGSDKHLRDSASMLRVSGDRIDRQYIERWVDKLGVRAVWTILLERLAE